MRCGRGAATRPAAVIVSVTALGAADGNAAGAAGKVLAYLDGRGAARGGTEPGQLPALAPADGTPGVVGYYADSVEGPGRWLGRGISGMRLSGEVDKEQLRRVLLGQHARSGEQLVTVCGSAPRDEGSDRSGVTISSRGSPDDLLTLPQAASLLGVSSRYLRRIAAATEHARAKGDDPAAPGRPHLDAERQDEGDPWKVTPAEVDRFRAQRKPPAAVVGYDLTFSAPKSVSILWATASPAQQAEIVAAVHDAVAAGMAYMEVHAAFVRSRGRRQPAQGLVAASYLHATSRALDPQLHCHVVVANMAERVDGALRAVDGRSLYAHAKTAGYLAAAELRHQLARRLGVAWHPAGRGVADVVGVSEEAIREMSRRADDIAELTEALGVDSATARQVAAYATRAAKEHAVDPNALRPAWQRRLTAVGFDPETAEACYDRQAAPALVTSDDRQRLFSRLGSAQGVTELSSTFDRRDVLQHVAEWAGDRLSASEIADLADEWLTNDIVVTVDKGSARTGRTADVIRRHDGRVVSSVGREPLRTTRQVLDVEASIDDLYVRGRHAGAGFVPMEVVEAAIAGRPGLGDDQRAMVRSVCSSGHRIQCVLGPAGSGKTTALATAVRAWEDAGYSPIGAAVQGTAAEVLGTATGMPSSTVASLLAGLDLDASPLGPSTVVVVDEASTLGNRDLARLAAHVEHRGAALRLVGDPAQHSAVAAGGAWRRLVQQNPDDTPALSAPRRQAGPEMAEVRLALDDYRKGKVAEALDRLRRDQRVVEAASADELLDAVVADWYVDRQCRRANPTLARSSMMADHHDERRELNRRARAMLAADGTLTGPAVEVSGLEFRPGDEVIARRTDRTLRSEDGERRDHVRNGERGRVVAVRTSDVPDRQSLVVDFERRGRVEVPYAYLARRLRPGVVGGLAHSYALTTHAAQGETYEAGRHLTTDRSSRPGVYVGLSRGRADARLYMVRRRELDTSSDEHPTMPRLEDSTSTLAAVTARLRAQHAERLATEADPDAAEVARLRRDYTLVELEALVAAGLPADVVLARRALADQRAAIAAAAQLNPDPVLVARLGPRPASAPHRTMWDRAVAGAAIFRQRWGASPMPGGAGASWSIGPEPAGPAVDQYRAVTASLHRAEVAALSRRPLADLLAERREVVAALAASGADEHADAALSAAHDRLARHVAERARHRDRLAELESAPRRRRNPQGIELARRGLDAAEVELAVAELDRSLAADRAAVPSGDDAARARVNERLSTIDAAIGMKAERAIDPPAEHLVRLLGERPYNAAVRPTWEHAARLVERHRHAHLGLASPGVPGPWSDGDPLTAAIGPLPNGGAAAESHDRARDAVAEAHTAAIIARLVTLAPTPATPSSPEATTLSRQPLWRLRPQLSAARQAASVRSMLERQDASAATELVRAQGALAALRRSGMLPERRPRTRPSPFAVAQAEADFVQAQRRAEAASADLAAAPAMPAEYVATIEEAVQIREDWVQAQALTRAPAWLRNDLTRRLKGDPALHDQLDCARLADAYGAVAVLADQAHRPRRAAHIDQVLLPRPEEPELERVWEAADMLLRLEAEPAAATLTADLGV